MKTFSTLLVCSAISLSFTAQLAKANNDSDIEKQGHTEIITIKSRVKGSQEQPNVTYIMPWQGINQPIMVNGVMQEVQMPTFKPINPKNFKKQVNRYYQLSAKSTKAITVKK